MSDMNAKIAALEPEKRQLLLQRLRERAGQKGREEISRQPRDGRTFALTYAQQRLWFLQQLEPNSPFYNIPESLAFEGQIDVEVLERALGEIIRRHESLRTSFHNEAGEARQVI